MRIANYKHFAVNESENLLMHTFFQNDDVDDDDIHTSAETDTF